MSFVREKFDSIDFMGRASESLSQFDERASGTLNRETMLLILTQRGTVKLYEQIFANDERFALERTMISTFVA